VKFWRSTTISPGKRPSLSHPIQGHDKPTAIKIVPRSINVLDILASLTPDETAAQRTGFGAPLDVEPYPPHLYHQGSQARAAVKDLRRIAGELRRRSAASTVLYPSNIHGMFSPRVVSQSAKQSKVGDMGLGRIIEPETVAITGTAPVIAFVDRDIARSLSAQFAENHRLAFARSFAYAVKLACWRARSLPSLSPPVIN
jgi:hypothetical protein